MEPNILWACADDRRPYREPQRKSSLAAAFDFYLPFHIRMFPGDCCSIPLNLLCFMPEDYQATLRVRSGIGAKYKIIMISSRLIDSDYSGEWVAWAYMLRHEPRTSDERWHGGYYSDPPHYRFEAGERIGQILFQKVPPAQGMTINQAELLKLHEERKSSRTGGFGSTGDT